MSGGGSDFEAEVKNSLRSIRTETRAVEGGLKNLEGTGVRAGNNIARSFQRSAAQIAASKAAFAQEARGRFDGRTAKAAGQGFGAGLGGLAGAGAGQLAGRFGVGGAAGIGGGISAIAALSLRSMFIYSEAARDARGGRADYANQLVDRKRNAEEAAKKIRAEQGLKALDDLDMERQLWSRSGGTSAGADRAKEISDRNAFISHQEARQGVLAGFNIRDYKTRQGAIETAQQVAATGESSFAEVMQKISTSPMWQALVKQDGRGAAARLVLDARGMPATTGNLAEARDQMRGGASRGVNNFIREGEKVEGQLKKTDAIGRTRVESGEALAAAVERFTEALDPLAKLMDELRRETTNQNFREAVKGIPMNRRDEVMDWLRDNVLPGAGSAGSQAAGKSRVAKQILGNGG